MVNRKSSIEKWKIALFRAIFSFLFAYLQKLLYLRPPPPSEMGTPSKVRSHFAGYMSVAFVKWFAKNDTAPLNRWCDHCLRSPHKCKICGDPKWDLFCRA